jgi:predicted Zn-dependent protease with MMP-like domain
MDYPTLNETEWEEVNRVWALLDEGQPERARAGIDALLKQRPGHPDLRIVDAAVALDEGEPERALKALQGAERSADPAFFFHLRATTLYELARFEEARADAGRALAVNPELGETHDLLSRVLEHLRDDAGAREHAETACEMDPESFPLPLDVGDEEFDALVEKSVRELPEKVRRHLEDLPVLVEPLPPRGVLTAERPPQPPDQLGLFVGRDLFSRTHDAPPSVPGAIFLYRRNLLRVCSDRDELAREIRITVQHEVGHMLGLDEDELDEWGLA